MLVVLALTVQGFKVSGHGELQVPMVLESGFLCCGLRVLHFRLHWCRCSGCAATPSFPRSVSLHGRQIICSLPYVKGSGL